MAKNSSGPVCGEAHDDLRAGRRLVVAPDRDPPYAGCNDLLYRGFVGRILIPRQWMCTMLGIDRGRAVGDVRRRRRGRSSGQSCGNSFTVRHTETFRSARRVQAVGETSSSNLHRNTSPPILAFLRLDQGGSACREGRTVSRRCVRKDV